jgi:hypothetical protein
MLRLTVLLCAAIFVTLLIAGEDKGQVRPGLAAALAEGEEIVVLERRKAAPVAMPTTQPEPAVAMAAAPEAVLEAAVLASEPAPADTGRKVTPAPVFTLSALPTVTVDAAPAEEPPTETMAAAAGDVWYVIANSVNVREGPSTETSIVDKLTRGEAVTVAFEPGSEWAQVSIEGDGMEGYVALRFLAPEAP